MEKKKEKFRKQMESIRVSCTGMSMKHRVCASRIAPDLAKFVDENEGRGIAYGAINDSWLLLSTTKLADLVADIFSEPHVPEVTDANYELFTKFMEELRNLRDEVIDCYNGTGFGKEYLESKVECMRDVLKSASKWETNRRYTLFEDVKMTYEICHRFNHDWVYLQERLVNINKVCRRFGKFRENLGRLGLSYSEEELFEMFNDILDGKRSFAKPVKVYMVVDEIDVIVDGPDTEMGFDILESHDDSNGVEHIQIKSVGTIK